MHEAERRGGGERNQSESVTEYTLFADIARRRPGSSKNSEAGNDSCTNDRRHEDEDDGGADEGALVDQGAVHVVRRVAFWSSAERAFDYVHVDQRSACVVDPRSIVT